MSEERYDVQLSALVSGAQKDFVDHAAQERQTSRSAIVRAAIEAYRRLHPTLDPAKALPPPDQERPSLARAAARRAATAERAQRAVLGRNDWPSI